MKLVTRLPFFIPHVSCLVRAVTSLGVIENKVTFTPGISHPQYSFLRLPLQMVSVFAFPESAVYTLIAVFLTLMQVTLFALPKK